MEEETRKEFLELLKLLEGETGSVLIVNGEGFGMPAGRYRRGAGGG